MGWLFSHTDSLVRPEDALTGRDERPYDVATNHLVLGTPMAGPWPEGTQTISLGMGCFWGAERALWRLDGVVTTAAGYQGGTTPNPTYNEVCTGRTGHAEVVMVAYDPNVLSTEQLLTVFWESHDPTQGYRQGADRGTQYRSAVYWTTAEQGEAVATTKATYQQRLTENGFGPITTQVLPLSEAGQFYLAEDYHQQYLAKNPAGYCGLAGTGVSCPRPVLPTA